MNISRFYCVLLSVLFAFSYIQIALAQYAIFNTANKLQPNSIVHHHQRGFLFSSTIGEVISIPMRASEDAPVTSVMPAFNGSSYGMYVDVENDRLLVCIHNDSVTTYSPYPLVGLLEASLSNGTVFRFTDLSSISIVPGKYQAHSVTVSKTKTTMTAYITDSYGGQIWQVPLQPDAYYGPGSSILPEPSVFTLLATSGVYTMTGIASTDDIVIAAWKRDDAGYPTQLVRVPIAAQQNRTVIDVTPFLELYSIEHITFDRSKTYLFVVGSKPRKLWRLSSSDNWMSAQIEASYDVMCPTPISSVVVGYDVYVMCADWFSLYTYQVVKAVYFNPAGGYSAASYTSPTVVLSLLLVLLSLVATML